MRKEIYLPRHVKPHALVALVHTSLSTDAGESSGHELGVAFQPFLRGGPTEL